MAGAVRPERIHPVCPTSAFPFQVGGKWTGMVVVCLLAGPCRFTELRAQLAPITPKVLSQTLRDMQRDGMVVRRDLGTNPPHVEYELTGLGRSLMDIIDAARAWSEQHLDQLLAARQATSSDSSITARSHRPS